MNALPVPNSPVFMQLASRRIIKQHRVIDSRACPRRELLLNGQAMIEGPFPFPKIR